MRKHEHRKALVKQREQAISKLNTQKKCRQIRETGKKVNMSLGDLTNWMYWSLAQHQYFVHVLGKFRIAQIHLRSLLWTGKFLKIRISNNKK